ncbi:MAG: SMC-Scp complex subunit ScpB, partial [Clostridia bacterium]|nr:SMC-Scp complex subunit ScpB [Clostridia bacterium]
MEENIQQIKDIEGAIEAILFAAGYPVKYQKIADVLGLDLKDTKTMIEHMSREYNSEGSKRGINLLLFPETCQLSTKEQYAPYIREALGIKRGGNLSASSMEVLAVVAYN